MGSIEYRTFNAAVLTALAVTLGILFVTAMSSARMSCRWHSQYGTECPTCHLTRALQLLADGEIRSSVGEHVGALALVGFLVIQIGFRMIVAFRHLKSIGPDLAVSFGMLLILWYSLNLTH